MSERAALIEQYRDADQFFRSGAGFETYCRNMVKIVTKSGEVKPFIWNEAQRILHARLEQQLDAKGWVRALILKARQLGISTYMGARYYRGTSLNLGRGTYILTHEDKATQNLFKMVKTIHDHMPVDYKPVTGFSNANELTFAGQDSGYRVGTAKNIKGGGRSLTFQQFHGSEVAFWAHPETHFASVMQALPMLPKTESVLESTANGVGGVFYDRWNLAEQGLSDDIAIFLPWYIASEYRRPMENFDPSEEELEYQELNSLDDEQLCWMHFKNIELGGDPGIIDPLFRQEYPANAAEAFQTTGTDSFIPSNLILRARKWTAPDQSHSPRVLGVDVARGGGDLTRIIDRQGRAAGKLINQTMDVDDQWKIAERVAYYLNRHPDIVMAFIDITGLGSGVYDILRNTGFGARVQGVNFGAGAMDTKKYANKRAEIWARMKLWLQDPGGADLPDDDVVHKHIAAPGYRYRELGGNELLLEEKKDIKARLHFSPDAGDAIALTFAQTVYKPSDKQKSWKDDLAEEAMGGDWVTG